MTADDRGAPLGGADEPQGPRRSRSVVPLLLFVAGAALGTAGRLAAAPLGDAGDVVTVVLVAAMVVLAVRWLVRRRARAAAPDGRTAPACGSPAWSAQRQTWVVVAAPFYGLYLGGVVSTSSWSSSLVVVLVALALWLAGRQVLRSSRRRRWAAARAAHPGRAVVLVAGDPVASMRLQRWAKTARVAVDPIGGDVVLTADGGGVALWRPARPGPVHRWGWDEVELSRTSSPSDVPHLVLTLLGPEPAVRARAVPAGRRRFDLALTVLALDALDPQAVGAATAGALDDLTARRP